MTMTIHHTDDQEPNNTDGLLVKWCDCGRPIWSTEDRSIEAIEAGQCARRTLLRHGRMEEDQFDTFAALMLGDSNLGD
jgi:hypothetical protein